MKTFISEIRRLKLISINQIDAIEKKVERKKTIKIQLNLLYGNPLKFETKINRLEIQLVAL